MLRLRCYAGWAERSYGDYWIRCRLMMGHGSLRVHRSAQLCPLACAHCRKVSRRRAVNWQPRYYGGSRVIRASTQSPQQMRAIHGRHPRADMSADICEIDGVMVRSIDAMRRAGCAKGLG